MRSILKTAGFAFVLALYAIGAWAQQPTLAPSHEYFNGPSIGMVYTDLCTVTGASPQTCNGMRGVVTTGTLTTATGTTASYTINNSRVLATSVIQCTINAYSGTFTTNGNPVILACIPGAGTITVQFRNVDGTNALNGTIGIGFEVVD